MKTFSLIEIGAVKGKQKFYKLVKEGICEFDIFESKALVNYSSEVKRIYSLMNHVAELQSLPVTLFRDITPKKENVKEYEIKTKHLRVYLFHQKNTGKIVAVGGFKNTQTSDINHFREMKKSYLNRSE